MDITEHLLTCLSEEAVEVSKDIHKALRFGLDDHNVLNPEGPTNRERIIGELNDLLAVVKMCQRRGILPWELEDFTAQRNKEEKVERFMEYAIQVGVLIAPPSEIPA